MALSFTRTALPAGIGFGLYRLGKLIGELGDIDHATGNNAGALQYHLFALVATIGALACFIYAGIGAFRAFRGSNADPAAPAGVAADPPAAVARPRAERSTSPVVATAAPRGFGRKPVP
ncbi:hypothetical protein [Sphingomonas sp.]|uniref:hypothetical protein n=1 Tax=Sphingomonas sp. TaxID=28214 RepID=UPI003CC667F9